MRALRLLVAGLVAVAAMAAVLLAALVVFFTGLAALVLQFFQARPRPAPAGRPPAPPQPPRRTDEVIDVVTTKVPADPAGH